MLFIDSRCFFFDFKITFFFIKSLILMIILSAVNIGIQLPDPNMYSLPYL
ncbi:hypothetical protein BA6E_102290 [Bacteroidales bacterium 6E]|nr:hypothetical protein BA6E_102290 [Bacteroidales bacterium 6E]